jgi:hypothetical protein
VQEAGWAPEPVWTQRLEAMQNIISVYFLYSNKMDTGTSQKYSTDCKEEIKTFRNSETDYGYRM